jgi:hypothetical protein
MERKTRKSTIIVLLYCIVAAQIATAQCENKTGFAKHFCEVRKGGSGSSGSGLNIPDLDAFKGAALTTSFADTIHLGTLPATFEPKAFTPLSKLERTDDGSFVLRAGIFEAYVQSYSFEPGDTNGRAGGFYPAPIKGRRAKVITDVLKYSELHPDVPQSDIQQLLWAIVGGADLEKMPASVQQTGGRILPPESLAQIQGSVVAKAANKVLMDTLDKWLRRNPQAGQAVAQAKEKAQQTDQAYGISDTIEDLTAAGSSSASFSQAGGLVVRGTWAEMPGGFFVRYLPDGGGRTRVQVIVPGTAIAQADPDKPLLFDPTQYLAVYGQTPPQRLGLSMRPVQGAK